MAPRRAGIAKGQRTLIECTEPDGKMQDVHSMEALMDEILASDDGAKPTLQEIHVLTLQQRNLNMQRSLLIRDLNV